MCTQFLVESNQGELIRARSMEFGTDLNSQLIFFAKGHKFTQPFAGSECRAEWTGRFDIIGLNSNGFGLTIDGMNSAGVTTGGLWLPQTEYQTITDPTKGVCLDHFGDWVLAMCGSVDDVRQALENGDIQVGGPALLKDLLPMHFMVTDAQGGCIVIEFLDGEPVIHDNPVKVMTNAPTFPWHLTNLQNYVALTPWDRNHAPQKAKFGDLEVSAPGHGNGLQALPGDSTPPGRFVRMAAMTTFADPVETAEEAVDLAIHIMNTVDIPKGISRFAKDGVHIGPGDQDYTQWIVALDLTNLQFYVRKYGSPQVYTVGFDQVDFGQLDGKIIDIPTGPIAIKMALDNAKDPVPPVLESA